MLHLKDGIVRVCKEEKSSTDFATLKGVSSGCVPVAAPPIEGEITVMTIRTIGRGYDGHSHYFTALSVINVFYRCLLVDVP